MSLRQDHISMPPRIDPHATSVEGSWIDPLRVCWRRKRIIFLACILGCLSGVLFWKSQEKAFRSSAQLLFIAGETGSSQESAAITAKRLDVHIAQVKSPLIKKQIVNLALSKTHSNAVLEKNAFRRLVVKNHENLLEMSFTATSPERSREQLEAIIGGYQDYLRFTPQSNQHDAILQLTSKIEQLESELKHNEVSYAKLLKPTPFVGTNRNILDQMDQRFQRLENKRQELQIQIAELQRQQQMQEHAELASPGKTPAANSSLPKSPDLEQAAARELFALELRERLMASRADGNQPEVQRAAEDTKQARQLYVEVSNYSDLKQEIAKLEQAASAVSELIQAEQKQSQRWSSVATQADRLQNEIELQKQLLKGFKQQLQQRKIATGLEVSQLRIITPPKEGTPNSTRVIFFLYIFPGVALGLVVGLLLAFCLDFSDKAFHTASEIPKHLGVPLLAELPYVTTEVADQEHSAVSKLVANYRLSQSEFAEQFRRVRTTQFQAAKSDAANVMLLTSPSRGDGSTLAAANLAAALAQTGKKTLLIDANLKHPQLHITFAMPNVAGLADLLAHNTCWQAVVQPTLLANVDLLPSGKLIGSPTELLSSPHWVEFLTAVRKSYDYIVIDCPALDCLDTVVIASSVDQILLLLRSGQKSRLEAARAFERLGSLTEKIAGVIMNNVENLRHVWRSDPIESFLRMHSPQGMPLRTKQHSEATTYKAAAPSEHAVQSSAVVQNAPAESREEELKETLVDLNAEVQKVVTSSKNIDSAQRHSTLGRHVI